MGGEQKQKQKQQQQQQQKQGQGRNAGGKKGGAEGGRDAQQKAEMEPPQAIVIADPFCNRFEATAPTPAVMLPLASSATPLIDNTLEMLRRAGISDIVVACGKDTLEPVAAHVDELQRGRHEHIKMVNCPKAFSVGDLLREVFSRQLISSKVYVIVCVPVASPQHTCDSSPLLADPTCDNRHLEMWSRTWILPRPSMLICLFPPFFFFLSFPLSG